MLKPKKSKQSKKAKKNRSNPIQIARSLEDRQPPAVRKLAAEMAAISQRIRDQDADAIVASDAAVLEFDRVANRVEASFEFKEFKGLKSTSIKPELLKEKLAGARSLEDVKRLARLLVPKALASQLAMEIDGEMLYPASDPDFPQSWPYQMRCLDFSQEAMDWVRDWFCFLKFPSDSNATKKVALTNLIKTLALATLDSDYHKWLDAL